jgi:hypothetical protein
LRLLAIDVGKQHLELGAVSAHWQWKSTTSDASGSHRTEIDRTEQPTLSTMVLLEQKLLD